MAPQTTAETQIDQGVRILGPPNPESEKVLTPQATAFVAGLVRRFAPRVVQLLDHRREVQARRDAGERPDFPSETPDLRGETRFIAPPPPDLQDRRGQINGPPQPKIVVKALNSRAR